MALNFAPSGLRQNRNLIGSAENFQGNYYRIKKGYASAIGFGDAVITLGSPNTGYIGPYTATGTHILGVLVGLLPYFDTTLQQLVNKNWYAGTENPSADVIAQVIDDINQSFIIQSNSTYTEAVRGQNVDILAGGTPNTFGVSTAYADLANAATTNTFPLRIVGPATLSIGGVDPSVTSSILQANGYIEVIFNTSERLAPLGI